MAILSNHYESAFAGYLCGRGIPHVLVDESRRVVVRQASLKSMDFIVRPQRGAQFLIDVKGRRFPSGGKSCGQLWENWVTEDDVDSLLEWEEIFGDGSRALFLFCYELRQPRYEQEHARVFEHLGLKYAFYGVSVGEYQAVMRPRSAKWNTTSTPQAAFERLRMPIEEFL